MDYNLIISIVALLVSIISLLVSINIYNSSKKDIAIDSFYDEFVSVLSNATSFGNRDESLKSLVYLKFKCGFLTPDLYSEFKNLLPILESLDLTSNNPNQKDNWNAIINFTYKFTKAYNKKTNLTKDFLYEHL